MGEPLFPPGSITRRISREPILLLGGRPALLMQIAHPLVAAGVADHSGFPAQAVSRLRRTLTSMMTIVFGDVATARRTAARIDAIHARVNGTAPDGRPYSALDPHLKLWVHCTLVDSAIRVYESCVARLTDAERAEYYEETKVVARLFKIPPGDIPATPEEMWAWMDGLIASGEVTVTDTARRLAGPILSPWPVVPGWLARRAAIVTPALLPEPIRAGYGLKVNRPRQALLSLGGGASRAIMPRVPLHRVARRVLSLSG